MVRQVDRERQCRACIPYRRPRRRERLGRPRQGSERGRRSSCRKFYPGFTVQTWAGIHWSDDPTFNAQYQRIVEGLRKAGLPEGEAKKD